MKEEEKELLAKWVDDDFLVTARDPGSWLFKAITLKKSADLIFNEVKKEKMEWERKIEEFLNFKEQNPGKEYVSKKDYVLASVTPVYMFLCGLVLENLLKGIAVNRNPERYVDEENKKLKTKKLGHNIMNLINYLEIQVNNDEKKYIENASEYILWAGRYPTPEKSRIELVSGRSFNIKREPVIFNQLFERFLSLIENEMGYKSPYK